MYELKVAVILAAFYLCFKCFLSQEKLHRVNRIVLISTAILSFVLPLCVITIHKTVTVPALFVSDLATSSEIQTNVSAIPVTVRRFPWNLLVIIVYLAGAFAVLTSIIAGVLRVTRLISRSEKHQMGECDVMVCDKSVPPFSWMNWIVMSREDYDSGNRHILEHEKAHIRLGHSKDVLLVDILSAFQWFNPAMWLMKKDLRAIHEFEADDAVLRGGADIKEYQYSLIRKAVSASGYSITNSFNHSILKNRITMMSKSNASKMRGLRVLYILPLVCGALALNAKTMTDYKVSENSSGGQAPADKLFFEFKKADANDSRAVNGTLLCFEGLPVTIDEAKKIVASASEKGTVSLVFNGEIEDAIDYYREVRRTLGAFVAGQAKPEVSIEIRKISDAECACFIGGSQICIDDIAGMVSKFITDQDDAVVTIIADSDIKFGIVSDVKDELRSLSSVKISYSCNSASSTASQILSKAELKGTSNGVVEYDFGNIPRDDIHYVRINSNDRVLFDATPVDIGGIEGMIAETIRANHKSNFFVQGDRGTSFGAFFTVQKQMSDAINSVRNEYAEEHFGKSFENITDNERKTILDIIPAKIREFEIKRSIK